MIEILMFFSLGFLTASLLLLAIIPIVHSRAERLTVERLEASIPISIAEVYASKDILRAEFALSTRRLEQTIEHLRSKTMAYASELSRRTAIVTGPQSQLIDSRVSQAGGAPHSTGDKSAVAAGEPGEGKDVLDKKETEIARLNKELDERSRASDAQRVELVAVRIQLEALKRQLFDIGKHDIQEQIGVSRRRGVLRLAG